MPLNKKKMDIALFGSQNEEVSKLLRNPTFLRLAENVYMNKAGQMNRRFDAPDISDTWNGSSLAESDRASLFKRSGELLMGSDDQLARFLETNAEWDILSQQLPAVSLQKYYEPGSTEISTATATEFHIMDVAVSGDFVCFTHAHGSGFIAYVTCFDTANGSIIYHGEIDTEAYYCRVVPQTAAGQFALVYRASGDTTIKAKRLTTATPAISSEFTLLSSSTATIPFDVIDLSSFGNNLFGVMDATTGNIRFAVFTNGFSQVGSTVSTSASPAANSSCLLLGENGSKVIGCYVSNTNALYFHSWEDIAATPSAVSSFPVDTSVNVLDMNDSARICGTIDGSDDSTIYYTHRDSSDTGDDTRYIRTVAIDSTASVSGDAVFAHQCYVQGHMLETSEQGDMFPIEYYNGDDDIGFLPFLNTSALIKTTGDVVARWHVDQSLRCNGMIYRSASLGSDQFVIPALRVISRNAPNNYTVQMSSVLVDVSVGGPRTFSYFEKDGSLYIGGGFLACYDGIQLVETGFHHRPASVESYTDASNGNLSDGTYGIAVMYVWTDAKGNLHRSRPTVFPANTLSGGGGSQSTDIAQVRHVKQTQKPANDIKLEFYRTVDAGAIYYRDSSQYNISSLIQPSSAVPVGVIADASIIDYKPMYTSGGVRGTDAPPAAHYVTADGDMAALIPAVNRKQVWLSKPLTPTVAPEFSTSLVVNVPEGGDNEAVVFMDGRTIVLKVDQIRVLDGGRPDARGVGLPGTSSLVQDSFGCVDWRSVAPLPDGFLFKSAKGWCKLTRALTVEYVGGPVQDSDDLTLVRSVVLKDAQEVRCAHSDGTVLVYSYRFNMWWTYSYSTGLRDAVEIDGVWYGLAADSNAHVMGESSVSTENVTAKLRTPWISVSEIGGLQRVWRAMLQGFNLSAVEELLTVKAYIDMDEDTAITLASGVSVANTVGPKRFEERLPDTVQRCQSIMFEVEWVGAGGDTLGAVWSTITIEYGTKRGMKRSATGVSY